MLYWIFVRRTFRILILNSLLFIDTSDLNLTVNTDCLSASNKSNDALCFLWAGARGTYGFRQGRICYEIRVSSDKLFVGYDGSLIILDN